jgi:hypothetical protein
MIFPKFIPSNKKRKTENHSTITAMRDPTASDTEQGMAR